MHPHTPGSVAHAGRRLPFCACCEARWPLMIRPAKQGPFLEARRASLFRGVRWPVGGTHRHPMHSAQKTCRRGAESGSVTST